MTKVWVDVPQGYLFGFPKLYDADNDGDMAEWIVANGYPAGRTVDWVRTIGTEAMLNLPSGDEE